MRAAAYCRVSTELQGDEGYSLEHQDKTAREEIARRGWSLGVICEEIGSASQPIEKRRKLCQLLDDMDNGDYDVLLVTRLDRLCRSGRDIHNFMHRADTHDWRIVSLDPPLDMSDDFHRAMAGFAGIWAELEARLISQRTKEAMAAKRARNLSIGGAPSFGDQDTINLICRLRSQGKSGRQTAAILNMEGIPTARGGQWYQSAVENIYKRNQKQVKT